MGNIPVLGDVVTNELLLCGANPRIAARQFVIAAIIRGFPKLGQTKWMESFIAARGAGVSARKFWKHQKKTEGTRRCL